MRGSSVFRLGEGGGGRTQGSKIVLVRSYLRVPEAAGQVKILIFLLKIKFPPYTPIIFVMQGKCLFSDISRPGTESDRKRLCQLFGPQTYLQWVQSPKLVYRGFSCLFQRQLYFLNPKGSNIFQWWWSNSSACIFPI